MVISSPVVVRPYGIGVQRGTPRRKRGPRRPWRFAVGFAAGLANRCPGRPRRPPTCRSSRVKEFFTLFWDSAARPRPETDMQDGATQAALRVPAIFYGLDSAPELVGMLNAMIRRLGDVSHPDSQWYIADNLLTFGH